MNKIQKKHKNSKPGSPSHNPKNPTPTVAELQDYCDSLEAILKQLTVESKTTKQ